MKRRRRAGDTGERWLIEFKCWNLHREFTVWIGRPSRVKPTERTRAFAASISSGSRGCEPNVLGRNAVTVPQAS